MTDTHPRAQAGGAGRGAVADDAQRLGELLTPFVRGRVFVLVGAPVRPLSVEANTLLDLGGAASGDHR